MSLFGINRTDFNSFPFFLPSLYQPAKSLRFLFLLSRFSLLTFLLLFSSFSYLFFYASLRYQLDNSFNSFFRYVSLLPSRYLFSISTFPFSFTVLPSIIHLCIFYFCIYILSFIPAYVSVSLSRTVLGLFPLRWSSLHTALQALKKQKVGNIAAHLRSYL